jgi:hypothetical protein
VLARLRVSGLAVGGTRRRRYPTLANSIYVCTENLVRVAVSARPARPPSRVRPRAGPSCRSITTISPIPAAHSIRPALKEAACRNEAGRVDVVVVYKIDRLTPITRRLCQTGREP